MAGEVSVSPEAMHVLTYRAGTYRGGIHGIPSHAEAVRGHV